MKWLFGTVSDFPASEYDRIRGLLTPSRKVRIESLKHPWDQKRSLTADLLMETLQKYRVFAVSQFFFCGCVTEKIG